MDANVKNPVRRIRKEKGLTQGDLAILLEVSAAFVSALELGASAPSERTLKKIGEIFFIDAGKLDRALIRFREERKKEVKQKLGLRMSRR